ncbi:MAG: hypothetical protein IJ692_04480 [Alloprevotella sp.]|nr:hypothetical protein [Alloprevotella sp.]MBR1652629.1 hypothetical protein [Alloprevotella sp.]
MPNIKKMEMAKALSAHRNVTVRHSLFGLVQTAVYEPTQSKLDAAQYYYTSEGGTRLEALLKSSEAALDKALGACAHLERRAVCNVRLDVCRSRDAQFVALQLFRYEDYLYQPAGEARFFEGDAAARIVNTLNL